MQLFTHLIIFEKMNDNTMKWWHTRWPMQWPGWQTGKVEHIECWRYNPRYQLMLNNVKSLLPAHTPRCSRQSRIYVTFEGTYKRRGIVSKRTWIHRETWRLWILVERSIQNFNRITPQQAWYLYMEQHNKNVCSCRDKLSCWCKYNKRN